MNTCKTLWLGRVLCCFLVLGFVIGQAQADDSNNTPFSLRIIHMNDTHSHLESMELGLTVEGEKIYFQVGGYPRAMARLKRERAEGDAGVLFLHAGDLVQGTLFFNRYDGKADLDFMNRMKPEAMVLGNHEFDRGSRFLSGLIERADFPILAANLDTTGDPDFHARISPYVVKDIKGERVGIIGLTSPQTPEISSPGDKLVFGDVHKAAREAILELEKSGVNKIIALTHIGFPEDKKLAVSVAGIDVVVGGHSHTLLGRFQTVGMTPAGDYPTLIDGPTGDPVLVVQAWEWGKVLGVLDVTFDGKGRVTSNIGHPMILVDDEFKIKTEDGKTEVRNVELQADILRKVEYNPVLEIQAPDKEGLAVLESYRAGLEEMRRKVVAKVPQTLLHVRTPGLHPGTNRLLEQGSQVAALVAESMIRKVRQVGIKADLAVQNAGGIRTDLAAGDLTVGRVYELLPFGNTIVVFQLKGKELLQALERGVKNDGGAFPYVSGGRLTIEALESGQWRLVGVELLNGRDEYVPLDPEADYMIAANSYLAGGRDGYEEFGKASGYRYDTGFPDAPAFMEYARSQKELVPPHNPGFIIVKPKS